MGRRRQRSRKILARYGWQCQFCRRVDVLQIHPIQPGSCLGDNAADKLIAVCVACLQNSITKGVRIREKIGITIVEN